MSRKTDKELVKSVDSTHKLLANFGLRSWAYDPGVACYDEQGRHLDFGHLEWEWLKPLLEELLQARRALARKGTEGG